MRIVQIRASLLAWVGLSSLISFAGIPVQEGIYRLVAEIENCPGTKRLCATVYKGTHSKFVLKLLDSKWDQTIRSALGVRIHLEGKIDSKGNFEITQIPQIYRESIDHVLDDTDQLQKL